MKRREFLSASVAAAALALRPVWGQPLQPISRGAVVIGVNKAGNLPVLRAAVTGARSIGSWLSGEGFEVKLFVDDDDKTVKVADIFDSIEDFVKRGTLEQLVIYFSGHGFLSGYSEYWMLSKAPNNPNEAISLVESVARAKQSGIPNVVFISDACRSTADSIGTTQVRGSLVFPNQGTSHVHTDVDRFLAALPGEPAYELPVDQSVVNFEGIYSSCFLDAFHKPDEAMVRTLGGGVRVVPNRNLRPYLEREVQKKAAAKSIRINQIPDAEVNSSDTTYIGRVSQQSTPNANVHTEIPTTIRDVVNFDLRNSSGISWPTAEDSKTINSINRVATESGFWESKDNILRAQRQTPPDAGISQDLPAGFTISGSIIDNAVSTSSVQLQIVSGGKMLRADFKVDSRAESVALRFADGTGTMLAVINGYVGNIVVSAGAVNNVSYVPAKNNPRWFEYNSNRARLDQLHATVASAARFGVFRIEGEPENKNQKASQLADSIRVLKGIDPTLGLYAAYAYAEADLLNQVRSVQEYIHSDLGMDFFDILMLSGALSGAFGADDRNRPFPLCPMLSQGWELLRVKNVQLPKEIEIAHNHLRPALWTTFDPEGLEIVTNALRQRRAR
jgi:hypothetical protein